MRRTLPARFNELAEADVRDRDWLYASLQFAIELELATIPPYLCAYWSINAPNRRAHPAGKRIRRIAQEEMRHLGTAANLLASIGGKPAFVDQPGRKVVPEYPMHLPGKVEPELTVDLGPLGDAQLRAFLAIELPESPIDIPVVTAAFAEQEAAPSFATIGAFYDAILPAFQALSASGDITISAANQVDDLFGFSRVVQNLADVADAIAAIKLQGEGTAQTPEEAANVPAHYYTFSEIFHEGALAKKPDGTWFYDAAGHPIPWRTSVFPLTGVASAAASAAFDSAYSRMLDQLHAAWNVTPSSANDAIDAMPALEGLATALMTTGVWPRFAYVAP